MRFASLLLAVLCCGAHAAENTLLDGLRAHAADTQRGLVVAPDHHDSLVGVLLVADSQPLELLDALGLELQELDGFYLVTAKPNGGIECQFIDTTITELGPSVEAPSQLSTGQLPSRRLQRPDHELREDNGLRLVDSLFYDVEDWNENHLALEEAWNWIKISAPSDHMARGLAFVHDSQFDELASRNLTLREGGAILFSLPVRDGQAVDLSPGQIHGILAMGNDKGLVLRDWRFAGTALHVQATFDGAHTDITGRLVLAGPIVASGEQSWTETTIAGRPGPDEPYRLTCDDRTFVLSVE
ncbi:MAG: hypothetical protein PF961_08390 [Planctomycetota bacterium]|jgi:hypothetical protein|nr:hypothetical protein [Planctomycetota bacterium]